MPFDGFVTRCVAEELNIILTGGRIDKIQQPERDEVRLTIRNNGSNYRLLLSSNAASPRIHLTEGHRENPERAPMFCMLLRKHIGGGKILGVCAEGFERVVKISVESANELGDVSVKTLIAEIMGKHSNIILINENSRIIDSLTHVDQDMSSVREVMPARQYMPPPSQNKSVPGEVSVADIMEKIKSFCDAQPLKSVGAAVLDTVMGASPLFCNEVCHKAGVDPLAPVTGIGADGYASIRSALISALDNAFDKKYFPCVVFRERPPSGVVFHDAQITENGRGYLDFYCWKICSAGTAPLGFDSMNRAADAFYEGRSRAAGLAQRKAALLKLVSGNISRCKKKLAIQQESLREAANRDVYKLSGELITVNIHNIAQGAKTARLFNYYGEAEGGEYLEVALDGDITPQANAQKYFRKYKKAVSAWKNAEIQSAESIKELEYLESVLQELEMSRDSREIDEIRQELAGQKYISGAQADRIGRAVRPGARRGAPQSEPYSFTSSDGLTVLVGKNNAQNDRLTLRTASSNDIWLHARNIPGSHVIIKKQRGDIPQQTLLEAAALAAYYSKARMGGKVDVDYTAVRHVRKPPGAKPGMVIYDNQHTLSVAPASDCE